MQPPSSYIKDIGIEINPEFLLTNTPMTINPGDASHQGFIGREHQRAKFLKFLRDGKKGIFLVTGERGIGKTSFVNHVLSSYKEIPNKEDLEVNEKTPAENNADIHTKKEGEEQNPHIKPISLTLSQSHPKEIDILWLMVNSVYDHYAGYLKGKQNQKENEEIERASLLKKDNWLALIVTLIIGGCWALWPVFESWPGGYTKYLGDIFSNKSSMLFLSITLIPLAITFIKWLTLRAKRDNEQKPAAEIPGKDAQVKVRWRRMQVWLATSIYVFIAGLIGRAWLFPKKWPQQESDHHYSLNWIYYSFLLVPAGIVLYNAFVLLNINRERIQNSKKGQLLKEFYLKKKIHRLKVWIFAAVAAAVIPLFILWKSHETWEVIRNQQAGVETYTAVSSVHFVTNWAVYISYAVLFICFAFIVVNTWRYLSYKRSALKLEDEEDNPFHRIKRLRERCIASLMVEDGGGEEIKLEGFPAFLMNGKDKKVRQYPVASNKEIEYELQRFLELVGGKDKQHHHERLEFIFIFDELDKVEPIPTSTYLYEDFERIQKLENTTSLDFRERKQAIINIIAGLKNFFTTADARFVFIAGHEMFDASLADIADRQSSLSSIFTYTFNIESFLREKCFHGENNNASLGTAIEYYLKWVFFYPHKQPPGAVTRNDEIIKYETTDFFQLLEERLGNFECTGHDATNAKEISLARMKLKLMMQKFIDFITYRSNGSPKKIIKGVHDFISIFSKEDISRFNEGCKGEERLYNKKILFKIKANETAGRRQFLYFNYNNQCRIGFLSYLYRPFLIQYGRSYKLYSDNIISSTSYLFDHLLKFHSFGFSLSHLELVPEILSTSKTPTLQSHLNNIIDYLRGSHIRRTEVGLFDFKFYSKTLNEITYISKLFEEEAAAFNFTLDEGYKIKIYLRNKILELRNNHGRANGIVAEPSSQHIYSVSHLNGRLGDLHFFDQEYDDAIVSYSDAIRPINNQDMNRLGMRDFVVLIKNKLKLGLCFEKINSFEEALSFYADSSQDAKRYIMHKLKNKSRIDDVSSPYEIGTIYPSSSLNDLLQIVNQCFLATILIEEKMGIEGISSGKLGISLGNFLHLSENVAGVYKTAVNNLAIANAYLISGKLFYFKNTPYDINGQDKKEMGAMHFKCKEQLSKLSDKFDELNLCTRTQSAGAHRKPTLALQLYIVGLCETMRSKNVMPGDSLLNKITQLKNSKSVATVIIDAFREYLDKKDEGLTGIHNRYIASFLSSIGDCLYALCRSGRNNNKVTLQDIFKPGPAPLPPDSETRNPGEAFYFLLKENEVGSTDISLQDVLKCYHLSAQFFKKYGRSHSAGYQYRKILRLLKAVLDDEVTPPLDTHALLECLEKAVVAPLLNMISKNYGHSERHMVNKGLKLAEKETAGMPFVINNVSNHPDTREVVLLYGYIRIKLGCSWNEAQIGRLVSPYNSVATQYGRFSELEFYAKYISRKIKDLYVNDQEILIQAAIDKDKKEYTDLLIKYLYTMLTMVRLQKIYVNDYTYGFHKLSYHHYNLANFLTLHERAQGPVVRDALNNIMEDRSFSAQSPLFHAQVANDYYQKATELHTAGTEYKKTIGEMLYLEDDFNDNAYHFGAAESRYLLANTGFEKRLAKFDEKILNDDIYRVSTFID